MSETPSVLKALVPVINLNEDFNVLPVMYERLWLLVCKKAGEIGVMASTGWGGTGIPPLLHYSSKYDVLTHIIQGYT